MFRTPADVAIVTPAARAAGSVRVPGDKSISHRYALLAAIADGESAIQGYSPGADCAATLACLRALGVAVRTEGARVTIAGRGLRGLAPAAGPVDAANSGTTLRLLAGIVAAHPFRTILTGDGSLRRRPMRRIMEPLREMGARIEAAGNRPPLAIDGGDLRGIAHTPAVPSAQVKSGVLLAGLQAAGVTRVIEPAPTRDHTERALGAFGVRVDRGDGGIAVEGGQRLAPCRLTVPGDLSSAMFWGALAAAVPGGAVDVEGVGLNDTRTPALDVLRRAGAEVQWTVDDEQAGEPVGRIAIRGGAGGNFAVDPAEVPAVIDEIPALAALAATMPAGRTFHVRGAAELRVKESDRIAALARGLRTLGAAVEEYEDGFTITARPLTGGHVDAAGDHRLAMAFAIAAARADGPTTIAGAGAVDVSYPGFFDELQRLTR